MEIYHDLFIRELPGVFVFSGDRASMFLAKAGGVQKLS